MHNNADPKADILPLLPLKDIVVFPQMILPVFVSEEICLKAVECALANERILFLSAFRSEMRVEHKGDSKGEHKGDSKETIDKDAPSRETYLAELACNTPPPFDVYDIGTLAMVMRTRRLPDGRTKVLIQGLCKAVVKKLTQTEPFPLVEVQKILETPPQTQMTAECEAMIRNVKEALEKLAGMGKALSPDVMMLLEDVTDPGKLADLVASNLSLRIVDAQKVLGAADGATRLKRVLAYLHRELEVYAVQVKIQTQAREDANRVSREQFLREQLRAIKMELGDLDGKDDIEELREKIAKSGLSDEANAECQKQLRRLERMNPESSEATITRTYLEWMSDLPWSKLSESAMDLGVCENVLNEDHYGLEKIKDRILEYIAVKKLNPDIKGPILCFVGPPGVGKTSLGRSIAKAINRKFIRISLGGVRDEAEIRGHRRTYVGSQPGRIIQALKTVGSRNPVIMLDEIDKLGADYKGDPSSALLEVLDPEQNHNFSDHYIHVPFDLSQVIFIANANRLDTIPAPLRDRLEVIEVSGYSEEEKLEIAKQYIVPKSITQNGLSTDLVQVQDAAIAFVINQYTRESGLRNLEKHFSTIVRKLARNIAAGDEQGRARKPIKVTQKLAKELLGEERYLDNEHDTQTEKIGVATGLAYTSHGGEVLCLEVNMIPGKGALTLTGQLGDVMKESAHTAFTYVRSRAIALGVDKARFSEFDIHLHIPAGAIPKDGPSAGIAIATALVSALKEQPMRQDLAMTGEISLHGRVLPVGGLKEKLLAAIRVGIKTVCVPERNKGAIAELPINMKRKLDIRFVQTFEEVVAICFDPQGSAGKGNGTGQGKGARALEEVRQGLDEVTAALGFED